MFFFNAINEAMGPIQMFLLCSPNFLFCFVSSQCPICIEMMKSVISWMECKINFMIINFMLWNHFLPIKQHDKNSKKVLNHMC